LAVEISLIFPFRRICVEIHKDKLFGTRRVPSGHHNPPLSGHLWARRDARQKAFAIRQHRVGPGHFDPDFF
jgi:hypothetical protein